MTQLLDLLSSVFDLLLVIFGFGLIIFLHELGHFVAARWAGIRVMAFAVGFGPAMFSYRKGMGIQRGSSEEEYLKIAQSAQGFEGEARDEARSRLNGELSPTEYRLNALPLGGYVKMLGQEDMDPTATSSAPDSYQNCKPWKRMIVISAGVVMNMITAAVLFVLVFMVGLRVEPPVIGTVGPGSPASIAMPLNAPEFGPGLKPGDVVSSINGRTPRHFSDLSVAAAIGKRGVPVRLKVQRDGYDTPLEFDLVAKQSQNTGLLEFGVSPGRSLTLPTAANETERELMVEMYERAGLTGVKPGMTLTRVNENDHLSQPSELLAAFDASSGEPVELEFRGDDTTAIVRLDPEARLESGLVPVNGTSILHDHLLGLAGVLQVWPGADSESTKQGLMPGDLFARLGEIEYPSMPAGIATIKASAGQELDLVVLRKNQETGLLDRVELTVKVSRKGLVGFIPITTEADSTRLSSPVLALRGTKDNPEASAGAESLNPLPGSRIVSIDGEPVSNFVEMRARLQSVTAGAMSEESEESVTVRVTLELAGPVQADGSLPTQSVDWEIARSELELLHGLGWACPFSIGAFEPLEFLDKAENPVEAVSIGLSHTRRVMQQTYLTFARLFQGTVKVEHLQGPVGIAHLGTRLADRGLIWLLFFMALISVNLAVINFMPLPIVDGGQFLMLVYEQLRGKPVPIGFQNVVTLAGLVLIGAMFLIVTFNDITRLLGF